MDKSTNPLPSTDTPARTSAPRQHADGRAAPRGHVRRVPAARAARRDEILDPLWLIAIAMAVFFGLAALFVAAG